MKILIGKGDSEGLLGDLGSQSLGAVTLAFSVSWIRA